MVEPRAATRHRRQRTHKGRSCRLPGRPALLVASRDSSIVRTMKNLRLAATVMLFCAAGLACAQSYPVRPIRLIVPFPPGGGNDTVARAIAQEASPALGQSIVVDNRPGAGGIIGASEAARAPADGYTLFLGGRRQPRRQPEPALEAPLRRGQGLRADHARRLRAFGARGPSFGAGAHHRRVRRLRAREPGQAQLRLERQRQLLAHGRGALRDQRRREDDARAIQGPRPRAHRSDERAHRAHVQQHRRHPAAHPGGQAARTRGDKQEALGAPSRRADHRRVRLARVRGGLPGTASSPRQGRRRRSSSDCTPRS